MMQTMERLAGQEPSTSSKLLAQVRTLARPLHTEEDLNPLLDRIGAARYVLLGEASHGTADYYRWRALLTQRLIAEKGFAFLAVEGDWPDCYRVNRYIKGQLDLGETAREVLQSIVRWPTWMWANEEVVELLEWLRDYNSSRTAEYRVGFYGLDVYSLWDSLHAILGYLHRAAPEALPAAWRAFRCFEPYGEDGREYARATQFISTSCENEVVALLRELRRRVPTYQQDGEAHFAAEQNALVLKNAESYYRAMISGGSRSWNIRDQHMAETLARLMAHHGSDARGIVWAHNTHVGDARFTDMVEMGEINLGQLVREAHASDGVFVIGFGSYQGTVIAGRQWEAPWEQLLVPPARSRSWEELLHRVAPGNQLLLLSTATQTRELLQPRGHRAIGVVYHPEYEQHGNYVPTILPRRYDAFLFLDSTEALHPLHDSKLLEEAEIPETYPTGV